MAKANKGDAAPKTATADTSDLEKIAAALDSLAAEAKALGEEPLAKATAHAAKRARVADKSRAQRVKKFSGIVKALQAKGLSNDEIIARLTGDNGEGGES